MKGYKALDKDMRAIHGNNMQYELGKTYSINRKVVLCVNGFHFCEKIEDLSYHYNIAESRIFEIEADGNIKSDNIKYAAQRIRLVRELSKQEINDYFKKNWKSLVKSYSYDIRKTIAEQGYGLDILVYDEDWKVRRAVAEQGYGLDILINDEDWKVRRAVADQGYGLDELIHDEDWTVRRAVAEQGYGLDILVRDECWVVREAAKEAADRNIASGML